MSYDAYTLSRFHWDSNVRGEDPWTYWASYLGPVNGHADTPGGAIEQLAKNFELMAKAIRDGEIKFYKKDWEEGD